MNGESESETKNDIPVLKSGVDAYYDTVACGMVPVKVLRVQAPAARPIFDLRRGLARVSTVVKAVVTGDQGAYHKGMVIDTDATKVVPRGALRRHKYSTTISLYQVEEDT